MSDHAGSCAYVSGMCRSVSSCMRTGKCIRQAEAEDATLTVDAEDTAPKLLRIPTSLHSVEEVLGVASKMRLPHCILISETESGGLVLLDSGMTMAQTNWLLDRLKALMLAPDQPMRLR